MKPLKTVNYELTITIDMQTQSDKAEITPRHNTDYHLSDTVEKSVTSIE